MGTPGEASTSAASTFGSDTLEALAVLALALPPGWVAVLENSGQIAITTRQDGNEYKRLAWADGERRLLSRAHGAPWRIVRGD